MNRWLKRGKYLPRVMRDFHDQKKIFKAIDRMVNNRQDDKVDDWLVSGLPKWVHAHAYTIDFFLWYMAIHGYTLQKSKKKFDFKDIDEVVS